MPDAIHARYPGGEWLDPVGDRVAAALEFVERAKLALGAVAIAVVLLYVGAKIEREVMKRQLQVLDGAAVGGDVDLTEASGGDRS
jgi:hypothetical protein